MLYLENSLRIRVEYINYTYVTLAFAIRVDNSLLVRPKRALCAAVSKSVVGRYYAFIKGKEERHSRQRYTKQHGCSRAAVGRV